jgi:hypothetical protein
MMFRPSMSATRLLLVAILLPPSPAISSAQATPETFCGLGPLPGSEGFEKYWKRLQAQRASLGYNLFCEEALDRSDFSRFALPKTKTRATLVFTPIDLSGTLLSSFEELGELPEHRLDRETFALRRYFRTKTGLIVSVFELAISKDGGSVKFPEGLRTVPVLGRIAHLTQIQTPSGKSHSVLYWSNEDFQLEVSIKSPGPASIQLPYLTALAESVARARQEQPR